MYRRQRSAPADSATHPTRAKILDAAIAVLNEDGFDRFTVQRVLEVAGVSRATLYNHFGDVDSLIEAALVATFDQELRQSVATVAVLIDKASDRSAFREALRQFVGSVARMPAAIRLRRTHTIALTSTRPTLAAAVASVQDEITDAFETLARTVQARGFARPDLDTRAVAVLLQAAGIGRIVDDAATDPIGDERWAAVYFDLLDRVILGTGD